MTGSAREEGSAPDCARVSSLHLEEEGPYGEGGGGEDTSGLPSTVQLWSYIVYSINNQPHLCCIFLSQLYADLLPQVLLFLEMYG